MRNQTSTPCLTLAAIPLLLAVSISAAPAATPLLPAATDDQVPADLTALPPPAGNQERKPVTFSWKLDPALHVEAPTPFMAKSREYWMTVDGSDLQGGVDINLTAPGALIRVSPARGAGALSPSRLQVTRNGRAVALQSLANASQLQAAGMSVADGTAIVKLEASATAGRYRLQADGGRGEYVVHVFEPESDVVLLARPDRQHVLAGQPMQVDVQMQRAGRTVPSKAEALLVAPDGTSTSVKVGAARDGHGVARFTLPERIDGTAGLWELQVFAVDGDVARDARTAFAVAVPTARLAGDYEANARRLRVTLPIEVASTGRFEVRGTLYATAADGAMAAVSQAHSADWFDTGRQRLTLAFDPSHLPAGYGQPFELRQLELRDQSRMAPIESREQALRF